MREMEWRERADGVLIAEEERFLLSVRPQPGRRMVRFHVEAYPATSRRKSVASGKAADIRQGMMAAETMADRFSQKLAGHAKPSVMIVDDDSAVRETLADTLRDEGYRVAEANCGEGALRRLERMTWPIVLITDIDLGTGMNGLELASTVRRLWPDMGILLISGDVDGSSGVAGQEEFLPKPVSAEELLTRVAAIIGSVPPPTSG